MSSYAQSANIACSGLSVFKAKDRSSKYYKHVSASGNRSNFVSGKPVVWSRRQNTFSRPKYGSAIQLKTRAIATESTETPTDTLPSGPSSCAIVGGGPAGLATAIMLARRGWSGITVFDRLDPPPKPDSKDWGNPHRSYNLGLTGRGQRVLKELEVWDTVAAWAAVSKGRKDWAPGQEEPEVRAYSGGRKEFDTIVIQRDRLQATLLMEIKQKYSEQVKLVHGLEFQSVVWGEEAEEEGSGRPAVLSLVDTQDDGGGGKVVQVEADLIVGADGARATFRDALAEANPLTQATTFPDTNVRMYKIVPLTLPEGWRKDLNYSARTSVGLALDALPTKEGGMIGVFIFKPEDERVSGLKTGEDAKQLFKEHLPMFADIISDQAFEDIATMPPSRFPVFSYCTGELHLGSQAVLLGDAIHTVKPYFGLGVNSAFEDVQVLERCLEENGDKLKAALQAFSAERAKEAKALVEMSREFDGAGIKTFTNFILPLIVDTITNKIAPWLFAPNTLTMLTNEKAFKFTEIRQRKRVDRVIQALLGVSFAAVAVKLAYTAARFVFRMAFSWVTGATAVA